MFFDGMLLFLAESAWALILHLSARGSFPRPLPAAEEAELVRAMLDGDFAARDKLIEHNLRLVAHIAKKYAQNGSDSDDLVSIGSIGLIKAVQSFRPESGKLTTYASRCIENEILMHLRASKKNRNDVPLSGSLGCDREGNELQILDILGTEKDMVEDAAEVYINSKIVRKLIETQLDAREAQVIRLRYGLEDGVLYPQHEVARRLGISRSYVSRIEKKALEKLKNQMDES